MNRLLSIIKTGLMLILILLVGLFIYRFYIKYKMDVTGIRITFKDILMYILLATMVVINILNKVVKRCTINDINKYNALYIIGLIPMITIFIRLLFDKTILSNASVTIIDPVFLIVEGYSFLQNNAIFVIILTSLLILYSLLSIRKSTD